MTSEEFAELDVDEYSDRYRFELIGGRLSVSEPPAPTHGCVITNIVRLLSTHVHKHRLGVVYTGETAVYIGPDTVRLADIAFVRQNRLPLTDHRWLIEPDLAIEVISPGNRREEMAKKLHHYLSVGTDLVWYIDPTLRLASVFRNNGTQAVLTPSDRLSGENVVEGFSCGVWEVLDT
jgi:Uma2 family endonuclease